MLLLTFHAFKQKTETSDDDFHFQCAQTLKTKRDFPIFLPKNALSESFSLTFPQQFSFGTAHKNNKRIFRTVLPLIKIKELNC